MSVDRRKKKVLTVPEKLPPLKSISTPTAELSEQKSTVKPHAVSTKTPAPPATAKLLESPPQARKTISISVKKFQKKESSDQKDASNGENDPTPLAEVNQPFTESQFLNAWKSFAMEVPSMATVVSYINSMVPVGLSDTHYQLPCTNIFQENELKKLLPELSRFLQRELQNSEITLQTYIVKSTEIPRNEQPEDIFKKMVQKNPALSILKKNLKLEID